MLKDVIAAIALLGIAAAYYLGVRMIPDSALGDEIGARGLPLVYASVLAGLSVVLLAKALLSGYFGRAAREARASRGSETERRARAQAAADAARAASAARATLGRAEGAEPGTGRTLARAAGMLAAGIVYVALVPQLGYFVTLTAVLAFVAWYQGERKLLPLVALSIVGAASFSLLFVWLLGVDMPAGAWAGLLR